MRYLLVLAFAVTLSGCGFFQGFRDQGLKMAGEMTAEALGDVVDAKLGDNFKELSGALATIPASIPKPPQKGPVEEGIGYTLGGLLAYIVGSMGKGYLRAHSKGGKDA